MPQPQRAYIFSVDRSGQTVLLNTALLERTGYTQQDIGTYEGVLRLLFRRTQDELEALYCGRPGGPEHEGGSPGEQSLPMFCRDGAKVDVRWHLEVLTDASGCPAGRAGIGVEPGDGGGRSDQVSDTGARYRVMPEGRDLSTPVSDRETEAAEHEGTQHLTALQLACERISSAQGEQAIEVALRVVQGEPLGADMAGCCFLVAGGQAKLLYSSDRVFAPAAGKAFRTRILAASKDAGMDVQLDPASEVFLPSASRTRRVPPPISGVASFVSTPIRDGGKAIGVLCLGSTVSHAFHALHKPMLAMLAAQSGAALARAQRVADLEAANARLRSWASQVQASILGRQADASMDSQKLEALVANLREGVLVVDATGEITSLNGAAREMLGLGERRLEGHLSELLEGPLGDPELNLLHVLAANTGDQQIALSASVPMPEGEPWQKQVSVQHPGVLELAVLFCPIVSDNRDVQGGVYVLRNLTQAQDIGRSASEALSAVTPDLRIPLTSILGFTSLLCNNKVGKLSPRQMEVLERVRRQSGRLLALINDLLDVAGIDSGKLHMDMGRVQLRDVLATQTGELEPLAALKHLQFHLNIADPLPEVRGDAVRLSRVVGILLDRAIAVSPRGVTVKVEAKAQDAEVLISILDSGPRVPQSEIPHLFDKFAHISSKGRKSHGSGLRFYLVHNVVRLHKGKIWLEPLPGKGNAFRVTLPVADNQEGQGRPDTPRTEADV